MAKAKRRSRSLKKAIRTRKRLPSRKSSQTLSLQQQLKESLEREAATTEILRMIARFPTDLGPALNAIARTAARLCDATDAQIIRVEGDFVRRVAGYGSQPAPTPEEKIPITRTIVTTRAIADRKTVHVHDLAVEIDTEFPGSRLFQQRFGTRTILSTPLLRDGAPLGAIVVRRQEVRPFTDTQIALLKTFADQAVIAIENVRLFQELQARNRELTEALEQQTATSEVLRVIASSPTELQPVLDTVISNAVKLIGADFGHIY